MKIISFRVRWYVSWVAAGLLALLILLVVLHRAVTPTAAPAGEDDASSFSETTCQLPRFGL